MASLRAAARSLARPPKTRKRAPRKVCVLSPRLFTAVLLAAATALVAVELARMDVVTENEGQRATPPAEMLATGDFVIPRINGETYLDKPPLLYWAIAGVYALTGGPSELGARLPTALCGVLLALLVYRIGRRWVGEWPARWGGLGIIASPYLLERARWANLDVPLTLAIFLLLAALYTAWQAESPRRRYTLAALGGIALAAAILLKGPVPFLFILGAWLAHSALAAPRTDGLARWGIAHTLAALVLGIVLWPLPVPFPAALAYFIGGWLLLLLFYRRGPLVRSLGPALVSIVVGVALAAPWGALVLHALGWQHIQALLDDQVVERTYTASAINSGHPLFYFLGLPLLTFPWGLLLPLALWPHPWRNAVPGYRFCLLAGVLSVVLFSLIAGKEYEYVMPAFPLLLLAAGVLLEHLRHAHGPLPLLTLRRVWVGLLMGVGALVAVGLPIYGLIEESPALLTLELALCGGLAATLLLRAWRGPVAQRTALVAVALIPLVLGIHLTRSYRYNGERSPQAIALQCRALIQAGHTVESTEIYPMFAFYARTPIPEVIDPTLIAQRLRAETPYFLLTRERFYAPMASQAQDNQAHENQAQDSQAPDIKVLRGPMSNKDLILLANPAGVVAAGEGDSLAAN